MLAKHIDTTWREGPVITVFLDPVLLEFDGTTDVVRWVLMHDGGFIAGDAHHFLHADIHFDNKYGKPIAAGWCVLPKHGDPRIHVVQCTVVGTNELQGRQRAADFVQATDAFRKFIDPYTRLEILPSLLD